LTWNISATATGYNIIRSLIAGGFDTTLATDIATTSYLDTSASNGTTYYFAVVAVNLGGTSNYSTQVSAMPLSPFQQWEVANGLSFDDAPTATPDGDDTPCCSSTPRG
jgi:hypothetical protein